MSGERSAGEQGNMLPLVVASVLALFAVLSFAIDQSIAYVEKTHQENVLDTARTACMDASFALVAKNSESPGQNFADLVAKTIRAEGFSGRATVWFFEAPASGLPVTERLWAIGIQLEADAPTVFARGFGIQSLPVASHRVVVAVPYASENVWRPVSKTSGRYEISKGIEQTKTTFTSIEAIDGFPAEIVAEVQAALPEGSRV